MSDDPEIPAANEVSIPSSVDPVAPSNTEGDNSNGVGESESSGHEGYTSNEKLRRLVGIFQTQAGALPEDTTGHRALKMAAGEIEGLIDDE